MASDLPKAIIREDTCVNGSSDGTIEFIVVEFRDGGTTWQQKRISSVVEILHLSLCSKGLSSLGTRMTAFLGAHNLAEDEIGFVVVRAFGCPHSVCQRCTLLHQESPSRNAADLPSDCKAEQLS